MAASPILLVLALALPLIFSNATAQIPDRPGWPVPVEFTVPAPPMLVPSDGDYLLVYELHASNLGRLPRTLVSVEVFDGGTGVRLSSQMDMRLNEAISTVFDADPADRTTTVLEPGTRILIHQWIVIKDGDPLPRTLRHQIRLSDSTRASTVSFATNVLQDSLPAFGPPVSGGGWFLTNGLAEGTNHVRVFVTGRRVVVPQRFGFDLIKLGPDGRDNRGSPQRNESYYGYGAQALAVASGIVAAVKDGMIENPEPPAVAIEVNWETVAGNYVILDVGGRYVLYAHLQPESITVAKGDSVSQGDVIGLVGNSGNATKPHLHLHVMAGPAPNDYEGVPFVFDRFRVLARADRFGRAPSYGGTELHRRSLPRNNWVLFFPE